MQKTLLLIFYFCLSCTLFAQKSVTPDVMKGSKWTVIPFERKAFIENKGQFNDVLSPDKQAFKYFIDKGYQVFFYQDAICYRFIKKVKSKETFFSFFESEEKREERERNSKFQEQYVFVKWLNANTDATIETEAKQSTYYSYVVKSGNNKDATVFCDGYSKLVYKNLYPGIDVEYTFHPESGIKYNLLIHPGADISQVQMVYSGVDKTTVKNGDLHFATIAGDIIDHAPVSYYAQNKDAVSSSFFVKNNTVSFNVPEYSNTSELIIDPWTVVPGFNPSEAYDNGVDNNGNIYIYGGSQGSFTVEKYASTGGAPIWSLANSGIDRSYYGDMLVESSGNFYLSEGFVSGGAHTHKYGPGSNSIWQSTSDGNFREHWRLALNCVTNKVIVAGGGTTSPTKNIAEIDVNTGTLVNARSVYNQSQSDVAGLCVDELGQAYLKHSNPNILTFTDNLNNPLANVNDSYNLSEVGIGGTPSYYPVNFTNGYNFMTLGGTNFLFTSDGQTVKKWDSNTHALISSATINGGQQNKGSGILADKCNNLFVGASNGVHRLDFNLVEKEFQATSAAVYDIAYSNTTDIIACGSGFLTPLPFGRESCGAATIAITNTDPCNPEINHVKVTPNLGTPPYTYLWDDGNTDSVRTNLSLGNHIFTVKDGSCTPSFFSDTVKIVPNPNAIGVVKNNPLCTFDANGDITVTLHGNQQITNVAWTPTVTNSLLNDSTSKATALPSGTYTCILLSNYGCSFDTTVTLSPQFSNPSADFNLAQACQNSPMTFTDNSSAMTNNVNAWHWDFGDTSAPAIQQNTSHTYSNAGSFDATLVITTSDGCKDTVTKTMIVHPLPTAGFSYSNVCDGAIAFFTDNSTIASPDIVQFWSWNFGDGTPLKNNENTSHLFGATGTYNVKLTATSNFGCKDSITKSFTVNPVPTVAFVALDTMGCSPLCVNFQNLVSLSGGNVASYVWNFGEPGAIGNASDGYHCYNNNTGSINAPVELIYDVSLTVTTDSGCVDSSRKTNYIHVFPNPIASFNADPQIVSVINPGITFTNLSLSSTIWNWNFGDDSTSNVFAPPPHEYADTGTYLVGLRIENQYGCKDSTFKNIIIEPDWGIFIPNAFTPNGDGIDETFQGYGFNLSEYHMRIFDRWGNLIYDTKSYDLPWDGTANGGASKAQQDVYVYQIMVKDIKQKNHTYTGTVTLIK